MKKQSTNTIYALIVCCFITVNALAQTTISTEPESQAVGGSTVNNVNAWSSLYNPASMTFLNQAEISTALYQTAGLKELTQKSISVAVPYKISGFGISYQNSGFNLYKQQRLGLSYGLKLSEKLAMGLEIARYSITLGSDYGKNSAFSGNFSVFSKLSPSFILGAQVQNINAAKLESDLSDNSQSQLNIAVTHLMSEKTSIVVQMDENSRTGNSIRGGLKIQPSNKVCLSIGTSNKPTSISFGSSVLTGFIKIAASMNYSQEFGYEPSLSLSFLNVSSGKN